ncbi:hypothetical protein GWK47_022056 [Chionoecetes opilio]|uniref:Uncharacterized protein n=1 Tax=Chionoecetes opilio TaxID=41210 RepID=A0A8J4XNB8_CHIOP|nr:hypothetical protein GWK47_022056 [Chionoecetes opilio]
MATLGEEVGLRQVRKDELDALKQRLARHLPHSLANTQQDKEISYSILTGHLRRFNELGLLPNSFLLSRLDEGSGVEAALSANNARYHKTCRLRYNKTKLDRAEKRHLKIGADEEEEVVARKRTRYLSRPSSTETKHQELKCFFCGEEKLLVVLVFMKLRHSNWTRVSGRAH